MKTFRLSMLVLAMFAVAACKKGETLQVSNNVTTDQAADMVSGALAVSSNGATGMTSDLAVSANGFASTHLTCGATKSDSVSRSNTQGTYTYSYYAKSSLTVSCNSSNQPDSLTTSSNYTNTYSGPNLSFNNAGSSNFTLGGLGTPIAYVVNGTYMSSGSFQSKVDTTNHGSNSVTIAISNLTVVKATRIPSGGTGTFMITGSVPKKGSFSYNGTVQFNTNDTATVTINGTVYLVNLLTGQRTRQ